MSNESHIESQFISIHGVNHQVGGEITHFAAKKQLIDSLS
jgi:hypothetical protein